MKKIYLKPDAEYINLVSAEKITNNLGEEVGGEMGALSDFEW